MFSGKNSKHLKRKSHPQKKQKLSTSRIVNEFKQRIKTETINALNDYAQLYAVLCEEVVSYLGKDLPIAPQKTFPTALKQGDQHTVELWKRLGALEVGLDLKSPDASPLLRDLQAGDLSAVIRWKDLGANFIGLDVVKSVLPKMSLPFQALGIKNYALLSTLLNGCGDWNQISESKLQYATWFETALGDLSSHMVSGQQEQEKQLTEIIQRLVIEKRVDVRGTKAHNLLVQSMDVSTAWTKFFLEQGADPKAADSQALNSAFYKNKWDVIQLLLEHKASAADIELSGFRSLIWLCMNPAPKNQLTIMNLLIKNGANLSVMTEQNTLINFALMKNQPDEVIKFLYQKFLEYCPELISIPNEQGYNTDALARVLRREGLANELLDFPEPALSNIYVRPRI